MGNNNLLYAVIAIFLAVGAIWLINNCKCGSKSNFGAQATAGRSHVEDTFLPIVMSSMGASSEQYNAASKMIRGYDQVCGKVSAADEIQHLLNTYAPTGNWTGLVSELNQDLYSVKQNINNCEATNCSIPSDCAYGQLNPTLSHSLPPGSIPGGDCISGKCQLYR